MGLNKDSAVGGCHLYQKICEDALKFWIQMDFRLLCESEASSFGGNSLYD